MQQTLPIGDHAIAVGMTPQDIPVWTGRHRPGRTECLSYPSLRQSLRIAPLTPWVVTPLVAPCFDALDVAELLTDEGYRGTLVVLVPYLPRPEIILRDIRAVADGYPVELRPRAPH